MSRPSTRADAQKQSGGRVVSNGAGIREWLAGLPTPRATWVVLGLTDAGLTDAGLTDTA